jgi:hypothetical protein
VSCTGAGTVDIVVVVDLVDLVDLAPDSLVR